MRVKREPKHAATLGKRTDDIIAKVAQCWVPPAGVGMCDRDGAFAQIDCVHGAAFTTMAHINNHPNAVHFGDDLFAKPGDATVFGLISTSREQGLVVVRQLHKADAQLMPNLNQTQVFLNRLSVLKAKKDGRPTGCSRQINVCGG